jgi:Ca-activated chloride channel family protein
MELFRYPAALAWLTAAFAGLLFLRFKAEEKRQAAARLLLGPSFDRLKAGPAAALRRVRGLLYIFALGLAVIAVSGPQWGSELTPITDLKGNIVIAVDASLSMGARDVKPSRMENARLLLSAIADKFADYRIGVVAFAGDAYVQCPLTTDGSAIDYFASSLAPGMLPVQGTDFSEAINTSLTMLSRYGGQKVLVLITDGEDHSTTLDTALKDAEAQNLKIFTVGIGTPDGELVPVTDSSGNTLEYKKDRNGHSVVSRLGEDTLMKIASRTGAAYIRYGDPDSASDAVRKAVSGLDLQKAQGRGRADYINRYQWPLALALLLLLIELSLMENGFSLKFRWKKPAGAAALAAALCLCHPGALRAAGSSGALAREGNSAYARKDWPKAFEYYSRAMEKDPADKRLNFNTGDAFYKMQEYGKAGDYFDQAAASPKLAAKAAYNKGNSLYMSGDMQGAIAAYRRVLTLAPADANAKYNLQKALEQLKQQQQPKNDKKNQNKKDQDKKNSSQNKQDQDKQKQQQKQQEQERQKAEAREQTKQILEMMKEKEQSAARSQNPAQDALRQAGKKQPPPRLEDW